jgi:hypothetical protein
MARLYIESLMTKQNRRKVKDALKTLPSGLDQVYDDTIARIRTQGEDQADTALVALSWIASSRRPLTLRDVQGALAIEPNDKELDPDGITKKANLLAACAGILVYNEETDVVSLVHYTLQEYFDKKASSLFGGAHTKIARTCLTVMLFDQYTKVDVSSTQPSPDTLLNDHLLAYAVDYWGWHEQKSESKENMPLVLQFLQDKRRVAMACRLMSTSSKLSADGQRDQREYRKNVQGLSLAAYFGLADAVECLFRQGMSLGAKDSLGWTALHWAAAGGEITTTMSLLHLGADVSVKDELGWTPLHRATGSENSEVARSLISHGADVNATDRYDGTPLYRAAQSGATSIVDLLLEKQAETETRNVYLQTALHRAAAGGYVEMVKSLLAKGADPAPRDHWGYTPRMLATDNEHDEVARLLPSPYKIKQRKQC